MVWGQESFRMLGVARAPESIEEFLDLVHPNERESVAKAIDEAIRHGAAFHLDIRLRRANGTNNRVVMRAQPILEGGQTVELFGIFLDVADRPFD